LCSCSWALVPAVDAVVAISVINLRKERRDESFLVSRGV
jgi:hypothetical protein